MTNIETNRPADAMEFSVASNGFDTDQVPGLPGACGQPPCGRPPCSCQTPCKPVPPPPCKAPPCKPGRV